MKFLKLTNSKRLAIVDDEDYEKCNSSYTWGVSRRDGIRHKIKANGHNPIILSRFILNYTGELEIDHVDRDIFNNLKSNLRFATRSQNNMNKTKWVKNASSQYKGVSFYKPLSKWVARVQIDKSRKHLGYFNSEIAAARAYDRAAKELFGEFAVLNFEETK